MQTNSGLELLKIIFHYDGRNLLITLTRHSAKKYLSIKHSLKREYLRKLRSHLHLIELFFLLNHKVPKIIININRWWLVLFFILLGDTIRIAKEIHKKWTKRIHSRLLRSTNEDFWIASKEDNEDIPIVTVIN